MTPETDDPQTEEDWNRLAERAMPTLPDGYEWGQYKNGNWWGHSPNKDLQVKGPTEASVLGPLRLRALSPADDGRNAKARSDEGPSAIARRREGDRDPRENRAISGALATRARKARASG
ncbi:MAG: hypothetical protein AAGH15_22605 [Myxococcota bacterium]